jgi:hypothetical protein
MDVAKYVAELLYHYECVVLPGLGGFIVNDRPATVNRINHQFKPPFRKVMFNVHLKANDGLLVNHIRASKDITYQDARKAVDQFVSSVLEKLDSGETYTFNNIGNIHYDSSKHIVFEQNVNINYNADAYGLTGFVSPPVKRLSDEEKLRSIIAPKKSETPKPIDRKPEAFIEKEKERKSHKPFLFITIVIIILLSIGWGIYQPDKVSHYWQYAMESFQSFRKDSKTGIENSVVNEARYIPRKLIESDEEILTKIKTLEEADEVASEYTPENSIVEEPELKDGPEPVAAEPVDEIKQIPPQVEKTGPLYYIIAGSFSNVGNANKLVDDLRKKGYEAQIADTNSNGMYRVAYVGIKSLNAAKQKLYAIRQDDNADAWLFRK